MQNEYGIWLFTQPKIQYLDFIVILSMYNLWQNILEFIIIYYQTYYNTTLFIINKNL